LALVHPTALYQYEDETPYSIVLENGKASLQPFKTIPICKSISYFQTDIATGGTDYTINKL
jgi:hypothetical protein